MAALAYIVNLLFTNPYNPHKKDLSDMVCGNNHYPSSQPASVSDRAPKPEVYQPTFAYIIALMVFGTAFGNMFVMRGHQQRYGSGFKFYSHSKGSYYNNAGYKSGQSHQSHAKNEKWRYRPPQDEYNFGRVEKSFGVPSHIQLYLAQLHMPIKTAPSVSEVKSAYRQFSLKYHPDMRRNDSAGAKKDAEAKFVQGTKAYDELIKYLERDG